MISVRVYGLLINPNRQVLVSDEFIRGNYYTKFPGGGLEFGEGTRDCLRREFIEEMNLKVEVTNHIYTTDFYQQSAFNNSHQILSVYYFVKALESIQVALKEQPFDFDAQQLKIYAQTKQIETFRFINWEDFSAAQMSLPIDKIVADLIKQKIQ
jgi:ADP-ribose pyrophosphatase YjhB (NUDIX family)